MAIENAPDGRLHLLELKVENVKAIEVLVVNPGAAPGIVKIEGPNGAGKSSALDALMYGIGGKKFEPPEVVRRGAESGSVTLRFREGLVVERAFSAAGDERLKVWREDETGKKIGEKAPQSFLDRLATPIAFDPSTFFVDLPEREQADRLKAALRFDATGFEAREREAEGKRLAAGRDADHLRGMVERAPAVDAPDAEIGEDAVAAELRAADAAKSAHAAAERAVADLRSRWREASSALAAKLDRASALMAEKDRIAREAERIASELSKIATETETARVQVQEADAEGRAAAEESARLAALVPDLSATAARLAEIRATNERVRAKRARAELVARARAARDLHASADAEVKAARAAREAAWQEALKAAAIPVPGLAVDGERGITVRGIPLRQASYSERLKVAIGVGIAGNPAIRVLLLRHGSLLDDRALGELVDLCVAHDFVAFVERVGKGSDDGGISVEVVNGAKAGVAAALAGSA